MCRCIDKAGGLDRYILSEPKSEAQSHVAAELRSMLQVQSMDPSIMWGLCHHTSTGFSISCSFSKFIELHERSMLRGAERGVGVACRCLKREPVRVAFNERLVLSTVRQGRSVAT